MTPPKDTNRLPVTNHEDMKVYKLPNKEFKIIIFKEDQRDTREHRQTKSGKKYMNIMSHVTLLRSLMRYISELSTRKTKGGRFYRSVFTLYVSRLASQAGNISHNPPWNL